jgi:hypothetical protein
MLRMVRMDVACGWMLRMVWTDVADVADGADGADGNCGWRGWCCGWCGWMLQMVRMDVAESAALNKNDRTTLNSRMTAQLSTQLTRFFTAESIVASQKDMWNRFHDKIRQFFSRQECQ